MEAFREVDGRPGYYGSGSWTNRYFELNGLHYDSRGKETVFDGIQYAWKTVFGNMGLAVPLPGGFDAVAQYLGGSTKMGFGDMVSADFRSAYFLLTYRHERNRMTVRYDSFRVTNKDAFLLQDNNNEDGSAWTAAYIFSINTRHRIAAEYLRIHSARPARLDIGLPSTATESQFQLSYRLQL